MNSKRIHPTLWGVSNVLGSSIGSCQQAPKLQQLRYLLLCCMNLHHCFYNHSLVCPRVDISLPRSGQFSLHLSSNTACKKQLLLNPQPRQRQAVTYGDVHLATWAFHVRKDLSAVSFPSPSLPLSLSPCSWILDTETVTFFYLSWLLLLFCFHHFHSCHGAVYSSRVNTIRAGTFLPFPTHTGKGNKQSHYIVHVNFVLSVHVKSFFLIWSRPATFSAPNFLNRCLLTLSQKKNKKNIQLKYQPCCFCSYFPTSKESFH